MSKYKLPPLVLFESHADRSVVDFLIRNLDYLRKAGYKKICFEIPQTESLEATIKQIGGLIPRQADVVSSSNPNDPKFASEVEKLRTLGNKQSLLLEIKDSGLEFLAIDMSIEEQLSVGVNSLKRNDMLSKGVIAAAAECDGGVIVVSGFGHCIMQQMIAHLDKDHADQYLWYHLHDPTHETSAHQELTQAYTKKGYGAYFPLGVSIKDASQDAEKIDEAIKQDISRNCYNYVEQEVQTSTANILKKLVGNSVSSYLRTDGQYHVDAIIPLPKPSIIKREDFLHNLTNTLKGIPYEVQESKAIIRDINSEPVAAQISLLNKFN
ncbi:hypothetical protein [Legionella hackeliae]|uniref:Uncharacterized protein n=1 Tax=Legionella hackeliae TaxID=449 RepID=A0A0A8USY7_LEGHA|nr:hypothetical protein [Legionella hackeliae]KTD12450.1 hypothetical protein Lhac_1321 [Legionella hackeliae]CEK11863.1 conserved protein of unknown function [Legionella hackeliae]STX48628.1 Uncharacterised protein [Legionella hackeliae]